MNMLYDIIFSEPFISFWVILSDVVHTGDINLQSRLRDVWTCRMILALAYVLCYLFTV